MSFRFENLDSIRTIAFFSTFLAHAFYADSADVLRGGAFQWAIKFREVFSFGVPIFFVLSGFLITFLMLKEQEEFGRFSLKKFYIRRLLRIWPVYYVVLLFGFVCFPLIRTYVLGVEMVETANPTLYVLFLSNFDQINQGVLPFGVGLGPTWSVGIEEQYYLVWPLLFLLFSKKRFIFPILFIILLSLTINSVSLLPGKHTLYSMIYLGVGALYAYLAYFHKAFIMKVVHVHRIVFVLVVTLLITLMFLSTKYSFPFVFILLISILIGYIIVYQCYSKQLNLKTIPFIESLGKYTYGLYLYHVICNFIIHAVVDDVLKIQESSLTVIFVRPILSLGLSLVLSYYSYHYYEKFFLRLKKKYSPVKTS